MNADDFSKLDAGAGSPNPSLPVGDTYVRYAGELKQFFRRLARRPEVADDLVQEVYVELLRYPPREILREPQAFLYKIAWTVLNRANARVHRDIIASASPVDELAGEQEAELSARDPVSEIEAEQRIVHLLSELPPLYGAALILLKRDGLSYSQIAQELKISVHTVKKYLARTLAYIKNVDIDA